VLPCLFLQAILPLRGKILNVERKDDAALYKNQEIAALIVALGLGTKGGGNGSSSSSSSSEGSKKGRGSKASSRRVSSSSSAVEAVVTGSFDEGEGDGEAAAGVGSGVLKGLRWVSTGRLCCHGKHNQGTPRDQQQTVCGQAYCMCQRAMRSHLCRLHGT
jgi:hypothetical protein